MSRNVTKRYFQTEQAGSNWLSYEDSVNIDMPILALLVSLTLEYKLLLLDGADFTGFSPCIGQTMLVLQILKEGSYEDPD